MAYATDARSASRIAVTFTKNAQDSRVAVGQAREGGGLPSGIERCYLHFERFQFRTERIQLGDFAFTGGEAFPECGDFGGERSECDANSMSSRST